MTIKERKQAGILPVQGSKVQVKLDKKQTGAKFSVEKRFLDNRSSGPGIYLGPIPESKGLAWWVVKHAGDMGAYAPNEVFDE